MKALVVDDSSATRFILGKMLKEIGYEVLEAENGEVALSTLRDNTDVIFAMVDWNMPVMNGYELVQEVRKDGQFADLVLMMVTTETEMTQVVQAIEAGANEYLMKPFTKEMVADKMALLGLTSSEEGSPS
ncbi:response regulator [bacterium]|nr:response regulator [bacterium]